METKKIDLLHELPRRAAEVGEYQKKEVIYSPGSDNPRIYVVEEGQVIISQSVTKEKNVGLEILWPEDIFGFEALLGPYATTAWCAAEYVRTLSWTTKTLYDLQQSNPTLGFGIAQAAVRQTLRFQQRLGQLATMMVEERLMAFLIDMAATQKAAGSLGDDGVAVLPPMTHELIAEFIGATRANVSKGLNSLRAAGCIDYDQKAIRVFEWVLD